MRSLKPQSDRRGPSPLQEEREVRWLGWRDVCKCVEVVRTVRSSEARRKAMAEALCNSSWRL